MLLCGVQTNKQTKTLKLYLNVDNKISWKQILEIDNGSCCWGEAKVAREGKT